MTRRHISRAIVAGVLSFGALAMAQSTAPPNIAAPQGLQKEATAAANEIKITGCLSATANAGAATGEANNASKFLLKTTAARTEAVDYALQPATPDVKLQAHAGHMVEITGRPAGTADALSQPQSNAGVSTSQPSGSTGMETIPPPSGRTLLVSSVRMISSSCQ
jgi:hypothetical protein